MYIYELVFQRKSQQFKVTYSSDLLRPQHSFILKHVWSTSYVLGIENTVIKKRNIFPCPNLIYSLDVGHSAEIY